MGPAGWSGWEHILWEASGVKSNFCVWLRPPSCDLATCTRLCLIKFPGLDQPPETNSFNQSTIYLSNKYIETDSHIPGTVLSPRETFKLNRPDIISRDRHLLAHILFGDFLMVPIPFTMKPHKQIDSKFLARKHHWSAVHTVKKRHRTPRNN